MALSSLDHCAIRTAKLAETRAFYVDVLGLRDGDRPDFPFPGNWLYVEGVAVVHLVGIDPDDPSGLEDYLGPIALDELQGSGAVDHIAFRAGDATGLMAGLREMDVEFRERHVPSLDLFQLFLEDPNGITVELNYFGEDGK